MFVCSFASLHSTIYLFVCSFVHSFIHSFIRLFIRSFIHSFVRSFIRSFIHSFITQYSITFTHYLTPPIISDRDNRHPSILTKTLLARREDDIIGVRRSRDHVISHMSSLSIYICHTGRRNRSRDTSSTRTVS